MKTTFLFIVSFCFLSINIAAKNEPQVPVQTRIENGIIEGVKDSKTGLEMYFGVPFAKPPVGELRWKAPQALENWEGILKTNKFGPKPVQTEVYGKMNSRLDTMSEDCLYLNVWAPVLKGKKLLPVLVYFFGGGFVAGDGAEPRYDGASMAQKGIVSVTVNYRLNIFGFFAYPGLSAEAPYKASGNYGYLDQNASLRWVKQNIKAFGGDPDRVTIAGESAGSISVSVQMASPLSKNLIAGAIGESGAAIKPTLAPISLSDAEKTGMEFAENAGYTSLEKLRALSTKDLLEIYVKSKRFGFPSVIDGYLLPKSIPDIFNAREQAQIPILVGWNSAEINGMSFMHGKPFTIGNFIDRVKETYPNDFEEVLNLYAHKTENEIENSATELASDRFIVYSTWKWFDLQRKNSHQPVYRYLFCRPKPAKTIQTTSSENAGKATKKATNLTPDNRKKGASHAEEIEYCLGNLYLAPEYGWEKEDYVVSKTMQNYFANFIITGNPNGKDLPEWPSAKANDSNPPVMKIDIISKAVNAQNDERFLFMDKNFKNR